MSRYRTRAQEAAAERIGDCLYRTVDITKPIFELTRPELLRLASAAIDPILPPEPKRQPTPERPTIDPDLNDPLPEQLQP